jgi:hypothetical protein
MGAVGIANFNGAYFLDALCNSTFGVTTRSRFVGQSDVVHKANDDENRNDERGKAQHQHLLGGFDRTSVVFVGLIVAVVAHSVLNESLGKCGVRMIGINFRL